VVPTGTKLHGLVELHEGALWLRIDLAPSNPLRERRGLLTIWTCVDNGEEQMLEWDGPMDADLAGTVFKVKWVPPVVENFCVTYVVESKNDGGNNWNRMWRSPIPGADNVEEGVIAANMLWPRARRAVVRIAAHVLMPEHKQDAMENAVSSQTPPAGMRLASTPFTVNADIFDMRFMDKGVQHMRKLKATLAEAMRRSDDLKDESPGSIAHVEECLREVVSAMDVRSLILRRAVEYTAPRGLLTSRKRVLLAGHGPGAGEPQAPRPFNKVLLMGLYHSCTHAVARELERRFDVEVMNAGRVSKENTMWKHRVHHHPLEGLGPNVLAVLMVKEPYFWLKSTSRVARNFWEIHPFREDELGEREDVLPDSIADLFQPFEHDTIVYPNAVVLWNDAIRSYFDDDVYPPEQSVIIRCEDFLFEFHKVMDELAALGLKDREKGLKPSPSGDRARSSRDCRTREQALRFYGDARNRKSEFQQEELDIVERTLDLEVAKRLSYHGPDPVATWTGVSRQMRGSFAADRALQARRANRALDASAEAAGGTAATDVAAGSTEAAAPDGAEAAGLADPPGAPSEGG